MDKYTTLAGMDVHARSVSVRVLVRETGEVCSRKFTGCSVAGEIAEWLGRFPKPIRAAYESGCTGFHLARELRGLGIDCDVIAVSTLPRSDKDKKQKCDKLDARVILHELASELPNFSVVEVPSEELEADRELGRAWRDAVASLKAAKQQMLSFLLRQGHVYDERTGRGTPRKCWTHAFWDWVDGLAFEGAMLSALEHYRSKVERAQEEADGLRALVEAQAQEPQNRPYVDAIRQVKGLDTASAYIARVEIGPFSRFRSGRKVSCWLGSIPTNSSSGDGEVHGKVTRAGNAVLRSMLVECVGGISRWDGARKAAPAGCSASAATRRMASDASRRMHSRYRHLTKDGGKHPNKAKMAVANELVRWVWAIGCRVEEELAAASS